MECILCGLATPTPPIKANDHAFCCIGCREVYLHFGSEILAGEADDLAQSAVSAETGLEVFLRVDGMHCSSCELLIERTALKVDGIQAVSSNYATSTVKIVYDPAVISEADVVDLLNMTGYRARLRSDNVAEYDERPSLLRLVVGVGLAGLVMMLYVAFFYPMHLGLVDIKDFQPIGWLAFRAVPSAILVSTSILIFYVGAPIFRGAWIGLKTGVLNMDNLLVIAIVAAYGYSFGQYLDGSLDLYFDVAAVIVAVVTVGRDLEQSARSRATRELVRILEVWTPTARIIKKDGLGTSPVGELRPGDHVLISEGESVPLDGTVVKGLAAVDESLLTGESVPVERGPDDEVPGGAVLVEGSLEVEVGSAADSRADMLARILWNIQSSSAGIQGFADQIARFFVPAVITLSVFVSGWLLFRGHSVEAVLLAGLTTLIVSCPCTFGLAVPLATAVGLSAALRRGIIITSTDTFEKAPQADIVALDKTGILSTGEMRVVEVIGLPLVACYAAAVERLSLHPIAIAIARLESGYSASDLSIQPGKGAMATVDDKRVAVGSQSLFTWLGWEIPQKLATMTSQAASRQGIVSYVGWNGHVEGAVITEDDSRPEWKGVIDRLRLHGRLVLITGAEHASGYEDQMDEVHTGVPPEAKAAVIRGLKSEGSVVMVGDSSNDAPALAAADLGIAFGSPSALAADAADVVILGQRLDRLADVFTLIGTTRRRVRQNLAWALIYNATAIPLAVTGLLNPLFAALAMSASSLLVVWNSTRPMSGAEMHASFETAQTKYRTWSRLHTA
jgi:Cu2+-exporting ATPase|tara:strand:- start:14179 stop:16548 length:2370 start_codon:yes stop_codon:yes gene_type:complete